jgi:hypothetical protein
VRISAAPFACDFEGIPRRRTDSFSTVAAL